MGSVPEIIPTPGTAFASAVQRANDPCKHLLPRELSALFYPMQTHVSFSDAAPRTLRKKWWCLLFSVSDGSFLEGQNFAGWQSAVGRGNRRRFLVRKRQYLKTPPKNAPRGIIFVIYCIIFSSCPGPFFKHILECVDLRTTLATHKISEGSRINFSALHLAVVRFGERCYHA